MSMIADRLLQDEARAAMTLLLNCNF